jgi:hypothetical protein
MDIQIYGTKFTKLNQFGDFNWMIQQKNYQNSLFIFNDNEEHHMSMRRGAGNAVIRPYNRHNPTIINPLSSGIPTGTMLRGGYNFLTSENQKVIDDAIDEIIELIKSHNYDSIYYSVGPDNVLGTGLFKVDKSVIEYIDKKIHELSVKEVIFL